MSEQTSEAQNLQCPFCGDTDFDATGLKDHLANGRCDAWNELPLLQRVF